jgi:hypothetical protein
VEIRALVAAAEAGQLVLTGAASLQDYLLKMKRAAPDFLEHLV